jgi:hypothetical protein
MDVGHAKLSPRPPPWPAALLTSRKGLKLNDKPIAMLSSRTQYRKVPYREKRKDRRVLFPSLTVIVDGITYKTSNWSFGGFLVDGCATPVAVDEHVRGWIGGEERSFPFEGRVTRYGGELR